MSSFIPKQYGLILKKKPAPVETKPPLRTGLAVFGEDDDDDDDGSTGPMSSAKARSNVNKQLLEMQSRRKQQANTEVEKLMEEDPNAFAYDEVYEDMQAEKTSKIESKKDASSTKAKPKYIANILKKAQERKLEDDRRIERKTKKEREAEGEQFAGKDAYVTEAYKKKMEEMRVAEEAERLREEIDGDVTKKQDMSGFYRNLLTRNVAFGAVDAQQTETTPAPPEPTLPEGVELPPEISGQDRAALVRQRRAEREEETSVNEGKERPVRHEDRHRSDDTRRDEGHSSLRHPSRGDDERDKTRRRDRSSERGSERHRSSERDSDRHRGDRSSERDSDRYRGDRSSERDSDRRRGDRSSERDSERHREDQSSEKDSEERQNAKRPASETNEPTEADLKAKFARRNDDDRVAAARAAAMARRKGGQAKAAHVATDD